MEIALVSFVSTFCKTPVKNHPRRGSQTNKYDFNSFVNVKNDTDESRMASGRLFQVRGPVTANDLSPYEVCVHGTWSFSHCQLISFLDIGQRLDDRTLPGTPERGH